MPPLDDVTNYAAPLPRAVREAAARAEQLIAEGAVAPDTTTVGGEGGAADTPVAADAPATPAADATPTPTPASETPPAPVTDYEQLYRTLQGKYNAEVPALAAQLEGLRNVIATMQTPPAAAPTPTPAAPSVEIPASDFVEYGDDLPVAARRWARAEVAGDIARLESTVATLSTKLAELTGTTEMVAATSARDRVMATLDAQPDIGQTWRATNTEPAFLAWLNQVDTFSGERRADMLVRAYEGGNAQRTAEFFRAFAREQTVVNPASAPAPHTPPAPAGGAGNPTLEDLAAPGRGSAPSQTPGANAEKRIWTHPQIAAFYRDVQKGVFKGRDDEKARIEADIIQAPIEGRIR